MGKMEIELTKTIIALRGFCSDDPCRLSVSGIYFDHTTMTAIATDGSVFAEEKFKGTGVDRSILIKSEDFKGIKIKEGQTATLIVDGLVGKIVLNNVEKKVVLMQEKYPDYKKAIQNLPTVYRTRIDAELICTIANLVDKKIIDKYKGIILEFPKNGTDQIKWTLPNKSVRGVLMPMRQFNEDVGLITDNKAKEEKQITVNQI